jgi:hypothetical protein
MKLGLNLRSYKADGWTNTYGLQLMPEWVQMPEAKGEEDQAPKSGPVWWSGKLPPPELGSRVTIRMNGFGPGTVVAFFVEYGYLGIEVKVDTRPDWHIKQNKGRPESECNPMVFGSELGEG